MGLLQKEQLVSVEFNVDDATVKFAMSSSSYIMKINE